MKLYVRTFDSTGGASSTTTYTYATTVPTNTTQNIWFLFDERGIRVSDWSLSADVYNQVSSSSYVPEIVSIDTSSILIFGADHDLADAGSSYGLRRVWLGSKLPPTWAGVFSTLESDANNSCEYDFSVSADLTAKSQGEFTITTDFGGNGPFVGNLIDSDISPDGLSSLAVKYSGGAYSTARNGMTLPSVPYSGTFPTNPSGPVTLQGILASTDITTNQASCSFIDVNVYSDNKLGGVESLGDVTIVGSAASVRDEYYNYASGRKRLNCTLGASTYLAAPADTTNGAHRCIEFTFTVTGSVTTGSVLASSRNTGNTATNQLLISSALLVTVSGPDWPNTAVYLNGVAVGAGGATARANSVNHVLIVGTATTNAGLFINANINGGNVVSGAATWASYGYLATWDSALSAAQITDILASRMGIITASPLPTVPDTIPIVETAATRVNTTPWQAIVG
jgi:hypothetical protein